MRLSTFIRVAGSGRLPHLKRMSDLVVAAAELEFLATAAEEGVLGRLGRPRDAADLAAELGLPADAVEGLAAWLDVGVGVGALQRREGRYRLAGRFARALARPEYDDVGAMLLEAATLQHRLLTQTPALLRAGRRLTLADQSGALVARSSRTLEFAVQDAIAAVLPPEGALRLLEVGCGSGVHVAYSLRRNPELRVLALDYQAEVAEQARRNLAAWGVGERCEVRHGDFRALPPEPSFDLLSFHNNIYYFPTAERVALLRHAAAFLRPGGRILLTTACRGGSAAVEVLNLWGVMTAGAGPLPEPEALCAQLAEAGFLDPRAHNLTASVEAYFAFTATR